MKFVDQLILTEQTEKSYAQVGRPKAIHWQDEKLFLCVFYGVNKKLKRKNQIDVAIEIKKLFKVAFTYLPYSSYDSEEGYQAALSLRMVKLKLAIGIKDNTFNHYLIYKKYNYSGAYERALSNLSEYFENATPAAIVQMRKRLLVKNKWEWGLKHLINY